MNKNFDHFGLFLKDIIDHTANFHLMSSHLQFSLANVIDTEHKVIYAIKFCSILPLYNNYFASGGSNFASIYRIVQNATQQEVELVQAYADSDSTENYYVRLSILNHTKISRNNVT